MLAFQQIGPGLIKLEIQLLVVSDRTSRSLVNWLNLLAAMVTKGR